MNKPDGIRYLRIPLADPQPRQIGYWLRSKNIISRFIFWRERYITILYRIWEQRIQEGLWDFGGEIAQRVDFPLSKNWRQSSNRKMDYSTCILVLL